MARPDKSRPGGMFVVYFIKYSWPLSFTVSQFPAMTPLPDIKSVLEREKCGNVKAVGCGLREMRWCWKRRNEESWLAPSCTLDNYSTKPLSPATHHFNFQLLTVFTSFSRKRMFENSHENYRVWNFMTLTLVAEWLGKTLFCWMRVMFE